MHPEALRALASSREGEVLLMEGDPDEPSLHLRCIRGHEWCSSSGRLRTGRWCPRCRKTIGDFARLVGERGVCVELLSRPVRCVVACTTCTHFFDVTFAELSHAEQAALCPRCAGLFVVPCLETACQIARLRGGECLTAYPPVSTRERMLWRCSQGHEWQASFCSVVNDEAWCPPCLHQQRESPGARTVREHLKRLELEFAREQLLGKLSSDSSDSDVDVEATRKLRFDFYVPLLRLAIEFDGRQHTAPHEPFGGLEAFVGLMRRDELKREWCLATGTSLLRVPHDLEPPSVRALISRVVLELLHDLADGDGTTLIVADGFHLRRLELLGIAAGEGLAALAVTMLRER
jgi:hypothetical protein